MLKYLKLFWVSAVLAMASVGAISAQAPFNDVSKQVNRKLVKVFGSGGFKGLAAYGSGVVISPEGHVLTASSHLLDTPDLRVHLHDGRRCQAKVIVTEPELDAAIIKIENVSDLPFFNALAAAKKPSAKAGDWVLGFSNQFEIATRDEPVSITRGVIAAVSKLPLQRGVFDAPYQGEVYVIDAVTNNPGAAGGALTTPKGDLIGLIGKELRNGLTETWLNYAIPINSRVDVRQGEQILTVSMADFLEKGMKGEYKPTQREKIRDGQGAFDGIVFVPNVVERTPPYIEDVLPGSPAAKGGLKSDDLVVYVDGEPIVSISSYRDILSKIRPGTVVKLEVRRGDRLVPVELTLEPPPKAKK